MTATPLEAGSRRTGHFGIWRAWLLLAGIAAAVLFAERFWLAAVGALWFDEAWTLQVATTPDWRALVREAYNDVNAPLFYAFIRLWSAVAGASDLALRIPGLLGALVAALLPLRARLKGLSIEARTSWGLMLFAWWGVGVFLSARCYGLLMAISVAQAIAFAQLLAEPTRRRAALWCGLGAAAVLTQYVAAIPALAQGLVYLAVRRKDALRTWPAVFALAPAIAWIAYHAPRLRAFSAADIAWHPLVDAGSAVQLSAYTINPISPLVAPLAVLIAASGLLLPRPEEDSKAGQPVTNLWWVAGAALLGLAMMLAFGALRPALTGRYLIPLAPGLLLGLVLLAHRSARPRLVYGSLTALYLGAPLLAGFDPRAAPPAYGHEVASETLMSHGVTHVAFLWDHETTRIAPAESLERTGAAFFRRAGADVSVTPVITRPGVDPNRQALDVATGPHPGIIWVYNRAGATAARTFPPRIPALDPRWTCERAGDETVGTLACYRAP